MLDEQARQITKTLIPKYPFNHKEVYSVVFCYLQECYMSNVRYSIFEIEKRLTRRMLSSTN